MIRLKPFIPAWTGPAARAHFFGLRNKRKAALDWMHGNRRAMDNRVALCASIVRRQVAAIERDLLA